eukprot:23630-Chlamydomonas_euryale.AAC.1
MGHGTRSRHGALHGTTGQLHPVPRPSPQGHSPPLPSPSLQMYTKPKDFIVRYLAERGGDFALNAYPERNDSSSEWLEMTANTQLRLERAFKELRLARYKPQTCDAFSRAGGCAR